MSFLTPGPLQIDPEWMTDALRRADAIRGARVVDMTCKPVGNGLVGDSYRFGLTYQEAEPEEWLTILPDECDCKWCQASQLEREMALAIGKPAP